VLTDHIAELAARLFCELTAAKLLVFTFEQVCHSAGLDWWMHHLAITRRISGARETPSAVVTVEGTRITAATGITGLVLDELIAITIIGVH
jgi:hypothetical protein